LSEFDEKDDRMWTFIFDVLSPRDPFVVVVYNDEFGETNLAFI
jgi:hypothetical protein